MVANRNAVVLAIIMSFAILAGCGPYPNTDVTSGFGLSYTQDFDSPTGIEEFEFTDPAKWHYHEAGKGGGALEFTGPGDYKPPVRSPITIGLISDRQFEDFVLEATDLVEFHCPVCGEELTAENNGEMAYLTYRFSTGKNGTVYFARRFGEHATYFVSDEDVQSFGKNALQNVGLNYFGSGHGEE